MLLVGWFHLDSVPFCVKLISAAVGGEHGLKQKDFRAKSLNDWGMKMQIPVTITERNVSLAKEIKDRIREKAEHLERYFERITSCRVAIEVPHQSQTKGITYRVRIDMTVPGSEIVVSREQDENVNVVIRDAFDAARRELEDYVRRLRGHVKTHARRTSREESTA